MDEVELRREAQDRMRQGALPAEEPVRIWAGPGTGEFCALCDDPIATGETELELEYPDNGGCRLHTRCHVLWELARLSSVEPAD